MALLSHLKWVEASVGRTPTFRFGPRIVDVDILFMGSRTVRLGEDPEIEGSLDIPHRRLHERSFVLGPLMDLCPDFVHPLLGFSVCVLLSRLQREQLTRVIPLRLFSDSLLESVSPAILVGETAAAASSEYLLRLGQRTFIMGIVNVTPDSFSGDGGANESALAVVSRARAMAAAGATIIDIGGQSTRPGAQLVPSEEELNRVLPVLRALRIAAESGPPEDPLRGVILSIDTFYACVARAAIGLGVGLINDVSGGVLDPLMLDTAAELQVPIVLMHMRGTPQTMSQLASYSTSAHATAACLERQAWQIAEEAGVVAVVASSLQHRAFAAMAAGIPAWNIILDPGLGFSKSPIHSLSLLRNSGSFRSGDWLEAYWSRILPAGADVRISTVFAAPSGCLLPFPLLYGTSRKGFISAALTAAATAGYRSVCSSHAGASEPDAREWGTAAAVTASIFIGADFVRVHNPEAMSSVVAVADAIHRGYSSSPTEKLKAVACS